jgi:hypothetical protein
MPRTCTCARTHAARSCAQLPIRSDEAFVEQAFRLARDHLGVRTRLTPANFLMRVRAPPVRAWPAGSACGPCVSHFLNRICACVPKGFAEVKVLLLADISRSCLAVHAASVKRQRLSLQLAARPVSEAISAASP